jgi:hypothetical protein
MPFALAWLVRELMAHESPFHLEFPRGCLAETLGGPAVRLDLWHDLLGRKEFPYSLHQPGDIAGNNGVDRLIPWHQH